MKNIKFVSCAILVFFTMCILSISAFALSGTGTEADPYLVSTPSDISLMHNDLDGYYKLTADIDMAAVEFEPIGNESEGAFTGTIDGDGHTISNLDINLPGNKYVGFIGYLEGTVKNLNLENVDACGYMYVGGVVGYAENSDEIRKCNITGIIYLENDGFGTVAYSGGICGINFGIIIECGFEKSVACHNKNYIEKTYAGGISGYNIGIIMKCTNNSAVVFDGASTTWSYAGGISGGNVGDIEECINYGDIYASKYCANYGYLGGSTGYNEGNISEFSNYGSVNCNTNNDYRVGGVSGYNSGSVANCSNHGFIYTKSTYSNYAPTGTGGIVGYNNKQIYSCINSGNIYVSGYTPVGGVCGLNLNTGLINQCHNSATIIADTGKAIGGIAGTNLGTIENCSSNGVIPAYGSWHGGIAGEGSGIINKTISVTAIKGQNYRASSGCIIANGASNNVHNSYYLQEIIRAKNTSGSILNFTSNENPFNEFDPIWNVNDQFNSGFPQLRNMPRHIDLNECVLLLKVGETDKLEAFIDGVSESVTWTSEDEDIALVSADGTVTAKATGDIMITATNAEGMKMNCLVHITKDVSSVSLNKTETQITAGSSETLTYTLNPIDANEVVIWSSNNESVATVDQNGVVTAKTMGTTTITVATVTSKKMASCEVTVVSAPITSVSISSSATVNKGTPYKLSLTVSPTQYEGTVTWSSSDESVATVSQDGTITGHKAGSAVITVKSDTGYSDTCAVTVRIPSTAIELNKNELNLEKGFTEKLVAILEPADTTDTVSWSSSNSSYASVASDGTITAKSAYSGTITITATTTSGLKAYCYVKVIAAKVPVSSVTLNNTELIMTKADTKQFTATVLPDNATDKTLTWTSSNEEVATVSNTGVVTAVGDGVAIITATSNNGMYHECAVKVISASGPSVVLADAKASPGGKAVVKANIVKNPGMSAYKFTVNYDSTNLTPINITANTEFGGTFTTNLEDVERAGLIVLWHSTNDVELNGELFTVEFDVAESAQYGDSTEVSVTYGGKDICNTNGDYIALYTDGAVVNIKEPTPGDVYEDEDVNVYDLTLLARYITFLEDFTTRQQEAGDVNNDLLVDIKDVVKLSQYLVD